MDSTERFNSEVEVIAGAARSILATLHNEIGFLREKALESVAAEARLRELLRSAFPYVPVGVLHDEIEFELGDGIRKRSESD